MYLGLLPMALRRTPLWYPAKGTTSAAQGAFFIETMTQFGTFLASEKGTDRHRHTSQLKSALHSLCTRCTHRAQSPLPSLVV